MQFIKISNIGNHKNIEVQPIPNLNEANHYLWVHNTLLLGTPTLYTINPDALNMIGDEE